MKHVNTLFLSVLVSAAVRGQSTNHVFSGMEHNNFDTINLTIPGSQGWATDRMAIPGYFSVSYPGSYEGASDAYNVNGYVKYRSGISGANQPFTFPVGDGALLMQVTISGPVPANAEFATAWLAGDPGAGLNLDPTNTGAAGGAHPVSSRGPDILSVSDLGQWDWQDLSASGNNVIVSVSMPDLSTRTPAPSASVLRLVGWDGSRWINLSGAQGGTAASGITKGSTLTGTIIPNISALGIGAITNILPISLVYFEGVPSGCNASLAWATSSEQNSVYFSVEASTDGSNFKQIAQVTGKNDVTGASYNYSADQSLLASGFYRLKMVDKDGQYSYSRTVKVHVECSGDQYVRIFPNPASSSQVTVQFNLNYSGAAYFIVTDVLGQQFLKQPVQIVNGANTQKINFANTAKGIYYFNVLDKDGNHISTTYKVLKIN